MAFDNISKLPRWLSDAFCRVLTGAGIKTRKLYTDAEQQIFAICRPLLLNGIDDFATTGALADRAVQITLQRIDPDKRMDEKKLALEIGDAAPAILGALLDALVHGLRTIRAYQESQNHGLETSLESSLTAKALLCWWQTGPGDPWVGTPKEFYEALLEHVPL